MELDKNTQAALMLCSYFNKSEVNEYKPLTPTEYNRLAFGLRDMDMQPSDLFISTASLFERWQDPKPTPTITQERIIALFKRGRSMAMALEKWERTGIWVLPRTNSDYPNALKQKIKSTLPAVLFGVGDRALLNQQGIGFVGSRSIGSDDQVFTETLVKKVIQQGLNIVSGGAKGIDEISMLAALNGGGKCIGVMADNLLKASLDSRYRNHLANKNLVLISPFYPESGFNTGNAMARNKYIYCLSQAVVTVKSGYNEGGTWNGTKENLNKGYCTSLIRDVPIQGNAELIKLGGIAIDESFNDFLNLDSHSLVKNENTTNPLQSDLFASSEPSKSELIESTSSHRSSYSMKDER